MQIGFASDYEASTGIDTITIFKGKKYNWQVKVELHIHIVDHIFLDCLEVIGQ